MDFVKKETPKTKIDIGIVGAGIAGLAASIALTRAGHTVTVFEKSSFKNEIGAAILLTPNANKILRYWGFDFDKARPVDFKQFRFVNAKTLDVALRHDFSTVESDFGDRMCAYHRVDLHNGLRALAEKEGARIELGKEVVTVDIESSEVEIKGGERMRKEFWVLADGCHCPFLPQITQEDIPTVKIGKSVYRWLAPFNKVMQHPEAVKIWGNQPPGFCTFYNDGGDLMMVTYPCRGGELLNCALFHDTRPEERDRVDWNSNTTHDKVLECIEGWSEAVRSIPLTAEQMKVYTVTQRPPSTSIYRGNFLCIGDTTHHMLPTHAQGGCSALEDAGALEKLFNSATFSYSPEILQRRLATYQSLRLPRSATTQILSSTNPRLTMDGLKDKEVEMRKFYSGPLVDWPLGCTAWSSPIREFFYGYNIFEEARKALRAEAEGKKLLEVGVRWFGDVRTSESVGMEGRV